MKIFQPSFRLSVYLLTWLPVIVAGSSQTHAGELSDRGLVVLIRHALAPGVGDPPGFDLNDCATQRNLNDVGREQARRLGDRLREAGARDAVVYTSEWCRCRETAALLGLGEPVVLPALNSFFAEPAERTPRLAALRAFFRERPVDGPLVILVTHQVTITALTDWYPASGDYAILRLNRTDRPDILALRREP